MAGGIRKCGDQKLQGGPEMEGARNGGTGNWGRPEMGDRKCGDLKLGQNYLEGGPKLGERNSGGLEAGEDPKIGVRGKSKLG